MSQVTFTVMDEAEIDRITQIVKSAYKQKDSVAWASALQALASLKRAHFGPNAKMDALRAELEAERNLNRTFKDRLHNAEIRIEAAKDALEGAYE